jgi:AmiR/NasT family two-component response regulator
MSDLSRTFAHTEPDALVIDLSVIEHDAGAELQAACAARDVPVVFIYECIESAMLQRLSDFPAYVCLHRPPRGDDLDVAVLLAVEKMRAYGRVRHEAEDLKRQLEDRKIIERAKGVLMRVDKIGEMEAYRKLQSAAREHRQRLADVARSILLAQELLTPPK